MQSLYKCQGKIIVCGMGKSGIIGSKIAATLSSVGTPSFFMHPGEAYHGDLGMVEAKDIVLLISNGGESEDVLRLLPYLKSNKNTIVAMTGKKNSTLARAADHILDISVKEEACPLQLAPTSSTTATLVMGDVVAVTLMEARGFKEEHYARFHPGGSLGRRLLTRVRDVMKKHEGLKIKAHTPIFEAISAITQGRCGLAVVTDDDDQVLGVITDGDVRRVLEREQDNIQNIQAKDMMTLNPQTIDFDEMIVVAEEKMRIKKITSLLVCDQSRFVGVVELYD
ncbi:MAG: KpsF/GutQ family sugar-phosphate isomerase [Planctomycetes bacterium]|nr:KpsF/GutQ family sugar-phosphate isomerase [Planctomycetota bacterium]